MTNPNQYQKASQVPKESIISSLREELSILKDIHDQTVKAGIAGFEAMVAENAVLKVDNELLRHLSFRDERNKLKEQVAKLEEDVAHWKYQADEAGMLRVRYGNTISQQADVIEQMREAFRVASMDTETINRKAPEIAKGCCSMPMPDTEGTYHLANEEVCNVVSSYLYWLHKNQPTALQPSPEILKDKNVQLDFHTNAPRTKQQRELDGEMAMGQLLENSKDKEAGNSSIKGKLILKDTFCGDTDSLLESAIALLELDNDHALVPHGIGGHANAIITSLVLRMKERDERVAEAQGKAVSNLITGTTAKQYQEAIDKAYEQGKKDAVPEGWVLVPVKPTPEMINAAANVNPEYGSTWAAYLSAAPKQEKNDEPV